MFITKIANRLHRGESGFTLIEMLVVLAILAILVGLVVPNFFGIVEDNDVIMIQGQHQQMRTAVFLYYTDTGEWPTEWSGSGAGTESRHQLWYKDGVSGWDGPYIERPILQDNRWGEHWGVWDGRRLNLVGVDNTVGDRFTVLAYAGVPLVVAQAIDEAMDDGDRTTGAVQWGGLDWPYNHALSGGPSDEDNFLMIIIASED